jgi:hypothetical protein
MIKHKNLLTLAGLIITIILLSTLFGSLKTSAYTKTTSFAGGEYFLCDSPGYFDAHLQPNSSEQLFNITQNRLGNVLVVSIRCYSGAEIKVVDGLGTTEDFYAVLTCGQPGSPGAVTFSDEIRNAGTGQNVLQITCTDVNNFQLNVDGNYGGCSSNSLASPCTPTAVESRRAGQDPATNIDEPIETDCEPEGNEPLSRSNCGIINLVVIGINFLSAVAGIVIVASIMMAGFQYMTAQDDPGKIQKAKSRITMTLIALVLFIFMYALLNYLIPGGVF